MSTPAPPPPEEPSSGPSPAPEAAPKGRRRGWRRVLLLSPLFLLVGLVLTIVELPYILPPEVVRDEVVRAVTDATGVEFEIRKLSYHPLTGLALEGVRLGPPEGFTEDVFAAERLAVAYDLTAAAGGEAHVESVRLDDPRFVFETRDGRTNVEALLESVARAFPPGPTEPEGPPTRGPLVPVRVVLDALEIGPLSVRVAGDGPQGEISQVWLRATGAAGPERLDVEARLETRAEPAPNVTLGLPEDEARPAVRVQGDLGFGLDLEVHADTHDGLALESTRAKLAFTPDLAVALGTEALPAVRLDLGTEVLLDTSKDSLQVPRLSLAFAQQPVLGAKLELGGLAEALEGQLGLAAGVALGASVGIPRTGAPARLGVKVQQLALPLAELQPYVRLLEPGARLAGRVGISELVVSSDPADLVAGTPEQAAGEVRFEHVQVRLPRYGVRLADLDGAIELGRDPEGHDFLLGGAVALAGLSVPGAAVARGTVGLQGRVPKLGYPLPGAAQVGLQVALFEVVAPPAELDALELAASVSGEDLLGEAREGLPPLAAEVSLAARGLSAKTGTVAPYRVSEMQAELQASPDRLVLPARADIPLALSAQVARARGPGRLDVRRARLNSKLTLQDPRTAAPGALRGWVKLAVAKLEHKDLQISGFDARLGTRASRATELGRGALAEVRLPRRLSATLEARIDKLEGRGGLEGLDTEVSLGATLVSRPGAGQGALTDIAFDLGPALALRGAVQVARGLSARPYAKLDLSLAPARLGPLVARLPKSALGAFADAQATGEVKASLRFDGEVHHLAQEIDLREPPVELDAQIELSQVGFSSAARRIVLRGLGGTVSAKLGAGGATFEDDLVAAEFTAGAGEAARAVLGASMQQHLGFADGEWSVRSLIEVDRVQGARGGAEEVSGLGSELLAQYPTGGDLQVPRFSLQAESAGVNLLAAARLSRADYGVLAPRFEVSGRADFDRLRRLLPELGALQGKLRGSMSLSAEGPEQLALAGAVELEGFGYQDAHTQVKGATGRIPLQQTLALPTPRFDREVAAAVGRLGDDLEARIEELVGRVEAAQGLVSTSDVLLVPPRHADHDALRPYRRREGADLRAELVAYDRYRMEAVVAEAQWMQGMLRLDHFEAELWGGDLLTDMVLQITPDLDVRARIRGTVTNLNLDVPYVVAAGKDPSQAHSGDEYETSATMDLSFALKTRSLDGRIEVTKLSQPLVERLYGGLELSGGGGALQALSLSERVGVRPVAAKIWIAQNLLNVQFDWRRLWVHVYYDSWAPWMVLFDTALIFARPILIPTLGGLYVIPTVNGAVYRLSLSGFIDPVLENYQPEARLQVLSPYVGAL